MSTVNLFSKLKTFDFNLCKKYFTHQYKQNSSQKFEKISYTQSLKHSGNQSAIHDY